MQLSRPAAAVAVACGQLDRPHRAARRTVRSNAPLATDKGEVPGDEASPVFLNHGKEALRMLQHEGEEVWLKFHG